LTTYFPTIDANAEMVGATQHPLLRVRGAPGVGSGRHIQSNRHPIFHMMRLVDRHRDRVERSSSLTRVAF